VKGPAKCQHGSGPLLLVLFGGLRFRVPQSEKERVTDGKEIPLGLEAVPEMRKVDQRPENEDVS
jgi:hypothetical protein